MMNVLLTILFFPVLAIFLLGLLLYTPIDYFRYKRTRYYKDTKEKYTWLCFISYYVRFYDLIKKENLPIHYYRCNDSEMTGYGYFVYKDILILCDYQPCYNAEKKVWEIEIEDEYVDMKEDVEATIEDCNSFLQWEACNKAVVLIDSDDFYENPDVKYEKFEFLPVDGKNYSAALKEFISKN